MSNTLRIILVICSIMAFILCIYKIRKAKLKIEDSIIWMIGSILLILMSVFQNFVGWVSSQLGFIASSNFVFFIIIVFLLIQVFINNIKISELNEKIKNLNHYIALKNNDNIKKINK